MSEGLHLTLEGINIIQKIKLGMNKGRKYQFRFNCMVNLMALHVQRFFSYLNLFTFFMLLLVTANNYLLMFIG